jgi:ribosomal protein S25
LETSMEKLSPQPARIAVYDGLRCEPQIVDIENDDVKQYIGSIAAKTYELASARGGQIPYTVILQVTENFIHAHFSEPCISILDKGNTIRFSDQGPGIEDKERAQLPGFTSATQEMRRYINGVGSGLPIVKEYLKFSNGRLVIEDNISQGTVITISVNPYMQRDEPLVYRESPQQQQQQQQEQKQEQASRAQQAKKTELQQRDEDILRLTLHLGSIGPTDVHEQLQIPVSTAHRLLKRLEGSGYLKSEAGGQHRRIITDSGKAAIA